MAPAGSVSMTLPQISWPGLCGSCNDSLYGIFPREVLTSLKQTPQVSTSSRAKPGRSLGSSTSMASSGSPYAVTAMALIGDDLVRQPASVVASLILQYACATIKYYASYVARGPSIVRGARSTRRESRWTSIGTPRTAGTSNG